MLSFLILTFLLFQTTLSQTELETRQKFNSSSFAYDLDASRVVIQGPGGSIRPLTLDQMPALHTTGLSYVLFELAPCGIILPETHPRATEMIYIIEGERVQVGFSEENGGRTIVNVLKKGEATFFPASLIHFEQNLACTPAKFLAALNSEDPGVVTMSWQTFGSLPVYALQSTFNLSETIVDMIKRGLPQGPAAGFDQCVKYCNLTTRTTTKTTTTTKSTPLGFLQILFQKLLNLIRDFFKGIFGF
jgi:oxalate decarboxylase/phosphoglucose isomerase-like protein (cupin superfamily)